MPLDQRLRRVEPIMAARRKIHRVPFYSFLAERSHLLNMVRRIASQSTGKRVEAAATTQSATTDQRFKSEGLPRMVKELRWLQKTVEDSGAKLVIAWFPARDSIYPESTPYSQSVRSQSEQIVAALSDFSKERGVPLFNPLDALKAQAANRPDELYYKGRDSHPRPEGYRIFAEELARFLEQRGLTGK
jgi:lysophospholipase L1-like esterase